MNIDGTDETLADEDDDGAAPDGMLIGYTLGAPSAFAGDCDLQPYDVKRPGSGCCAVITCGACRKLFRIDLLSSNHPKCPGCRTQYTSLLVICQADDDEMLQDVFEHLSEVNQGAEPNPAEPEPDDVDVGAEPLRPASVADDE